MDSVSGLLLTEEAPMPTLLKEADKIASASQNEQINAVKDFESVFISKLLDAMESTVGDWGMEKDAASKQGEGIFSLYLGRYLGQSGGLGMWKDIYKYLHNADDTDKTVESGG
jgi:Rod binding domain-containing protein